MKNTFKHIDSNYKVATHFHFYITHNRTKMSSRPKTTAQPPERRRSRSRKRHLSADRMRSTSRGRGQEEENATKQDEYVNGYSDACKDMEQRLKINLADMTSHIDDRQTDDEEEDDDDDDGDDDEDEEDEDDEDDTNQDERDRIEDLISSLQDRLADL